MKDLRKWARFEKVGKAGEDEDTDG